MSNMLAVGEPALNGTSGAPTTIGDQALSETVIDPVRDDGWDSLVGGHPDSTVFHSAAWARTLFRAYGHRAFYCRYQCEGRVTALVPIIEVNSVVTGRRGVCVPFADLSSPLVFDPRATELVSAKLVELGVERRWKYLEIRGVPALQPNALPAASFYGHSLELGKSLDGLFEGFSSSVRRAIRKAQRSGVTVSTTRARAAIIEYYRLHSQTRRRHGSPPQPLSFFLSVYEEVISRGHGFVALASKGGRVFAGAVFLNFGRNAVFKYGASDPEFQEFRGNNLIFWEAIKMLVQSGCQRLHFGRTAMTSESLRRFKLGWGTTEERIEYTRLPMRESAGASLLRREKEVGAALFRRLPVMINRWVGALLYPHLD